jgi:ribosome-associated protein
MMNEVFTLSGEYIALCDLLKVCGFADSGGAAKYMISQGHIDVNGVTELRKTCKIYSGFKVSGWDFNIDVVSSSP